MVPWICHNIRVAYAQTSSELSASCIAGNEIGLIFVNQNNWRIADYDFYVTRIKSIKNVTSCRDSRSTKSIETR